MRNDELSVQSMDYAVTTSTAIMISYIISHPLFLFIFILVCPLVYFTVSWIWKQLRGSEDEFFDDQGNHCHRVYRDSNGGSILAYSGDQRYLDGKPIKTIEDFERWQVVNNHALAIKDHLRGLRIRFLDPHEARAEQLYQEWQSQYQYYRQLVVRHCLWNIAVEIYAPFVESPRQLEIEKSFLEKQEKEFEQTKPAREAYMLSAYEEYLAEREMLDYLEQCRHKKCKKRKMIEDLAAGDMEKRKLLNRRFHSLELRGIVGQQKDDNGDLVARRIIRRKLQKEESLPIPEKSVYRPEWYRGVDRVAILKSVETVGQPFEVDRDAGTCHFKSLVTGEEYRTSLEKCSCLAFENDNRTPCKHMIALSRYLGLFP